MKSLSLYTAHSLYVCRSDCQFHYQSVSYPLLHQLVLAVNRLERTLGDEAHDPYWQSLLRELKHYRFALVAAPLPVNWSGQRMQSLLHHETKQCSYLYPHFVPHLEEIATLLHALSTHKDNPLLDALLPLTRGSSGSSVVLLMNGTHLYPFFDEVRATVPAFREVELVNIYQLKGTTCYDRLIVIGRCRWYPEYVLRAPRATHIHFVRYAWMKEVWKPGPLFQAERSIQSLASGKRGQDLTPDREPIAFQSETTESEIELPPIEWGEIEADMLRQTPGEHDQEEGQARLCLLADGYAVLVDVDVQARVFILDLGEEETEEEENAFQSVKQLSVRDIQPGMFLLLRTSGGGDYLIPIADQLLGEQARQMRAMQEEWKKRLRAKVEASSLIEVSLELIDHGSQLANEINLRHWMAERSIHPHEYRDFLAIMRIIGMEDMTEQYWTNAQHIETAHRRAGIHIRKRLLAHVTRSDVSSLEKTGRMDFELSEMGTSSLSAFRIEHIGPSTFIIPANRIGRLYSTRKLSWLE